MHICDRVMKALQRQRNFEYLPTIEKFTGIHWAVNGTFLNQN